MGCYRKPCSWNEPQYILMILLLSFDVSIQRHIGNHLALVGSSGARTPAGSFHVRPHEPVPPQNGKARSKATHSLFAAAVMTAGQSQAQKSSGGESWIHDPSIAAAVARVLHEHSGFAENSGS
jgi:hypothetical protein